ncbi:hypothetical protein L1987_80838 [Smallanthus sonchifolius]|uniref:Uncharacterized protein n=1 Tax=Smallanthus sonchifolius TaxID=185202 RepID=A0ACB8YPE4_9ASTR|nr:hypothetical protein L1987_80838 [Smallanthus sonchifolius]
MTVTACDEDQEGVDSPGDQGTRRRCSGRRVWPVASTSARGRSGGGGMAASMLVASIHTYNILSESNIATFTIHRYLQLIQVCAPSCKLETGNDLDLVIKSLNEL